MKIDVKYNVLEQTEAMCGPFVFIRDGDRITNFEGEIWEGFEYERT